MKGVGRRRTQLLDDMRNRRRYWELKEEAQGSACPTSDHEVAGSIPDTFMNFKTGTIQPREDNWVYKFEK